MAVKETLEVLELVKGLAAAYKAGKADGNLNWKDLLNPETKALLGDTKDAVAGFSHIKEELSSLSGEDVEALYSALVEVVDEAIKAFA